MICLYVGAGCVVYSIFTIQHPKGPEYTIPISVTMQCVLNFTFQFFFVYTWIWVAITVKEFTGFEWALMMQTMENCKTVVMFCIVCIINAHSKPVNSLMVIAAQIQMNTKKNWKVRLMTHCMVGEIGIVYSGPLGCWMVKML